jgi:hypothetical protein
MEQNLVYFLPSSKIPSRRYVLKLGFCFKCSTAFFSLLISELTSIRTEIH